jgi:hypothetical protein
METLLNLSTLSIEEVTGRLKAMGNHEEAHPTNPIFDDSKLLFTEQMVCEMPQIDHVELLCDTCMVTKHK